MLYQFGIYGDVYFKATKTDVLTRLLCHVSITWNDTWKTPLNAFHGKIRSIYFELSNLEKEVHSFATLNFVNHYPYLIANANLKFNVNEWYNTENRCPLWFLSPNKDMIIGYNALLLFCWIIKVVLSNGILILLWKFDGDLWMWNCHNSPRHR